MDCCVKVAEPNQYWYNEPKQRHPLTLTHTWKTTQMEFIEVKCILYVFHDAHRMGHDWVEFLQDLCEHTHTHSVFCCLAYLTYLSIRRACCFCRSKLCTLHWQRRRDARTRPFLAISFPWHDNRQNSSNDCIDIYIVCILISIILKARNKFDGKAIVKMNFHNLKGSRLRLFWALALMSHMCIQFRRIIFSSICSMFHNADNINSITSIELSGHQFSSPYTHHPPSPSPAAAFTTPSPPRILHADPITRRICRSCSILHAIHILCSTVTV